MSRPFSDSAEAGESAGPSNITISVVIPAYDAADTVLDSVRSVVAQSWSDWELLLVDHGSVDDTRRSIEAVEDPRVRVVAGEHEGVPAARNRGIESAHGSVVTFLDAGDEADRDWLESFASVFADDVGLVCCGVLADDGQRASARLPLHDPRVEGGTLFLPGSFAVRRSILEEIGGFDPVLKYGEDTEIGLRIVDAVVTSGLRAASVDRPLIRRRVDPGRSDRRDRDRLEGAERLLETHSDLLGERPELRARYRRIAAVNAARIGHVGRARAHARQAVRARPGEWASWTTLVRSYVPLLRRRWSAPSPGARSSALPARRVGAPLVSVLLPVYNGAATLERSMHSVLSQSFDDFELLAVDDGSSDASPEILDRFAAGDRRVRVVTNERNLGLVGSLNRGLKESQATFVARLDQDDWAEPTRLERQVAALGDGRRSLCATAVRMVDPSGSVLKTRTPPPTHGALAAGLLVGNQLVHSSVMFRRDLALRAGGYDPRWELAEDFDLWLRMLELGEYVAVPTIEGEYLDNPDGMSRTRAAAQRRLAEQRAADFRSDLTGRPASPSHAGPTLAREVVSAQSALKVRLRRRGIPTEDVDRVALRVAKTALSSRGRVARLVTVFLCSPRLAISPWLPKRSRDRLATDG